MGGDSSIVPRKSRAMNLPAGCGSTVSTEMQYSDGLVFVQPEFNQPYLTIEQVKQRNSVCRR